MMKKIIAQKKQKYVVTFIAAAVSFLGLEALSLTIKVYQIPIFFWIALLVYLFLVFLQTFIFDLHLKPANSLKVLERSFFGAVRNRLRYLKNFNHWLHYQNYLILPGIIFWSTVILLFLNPFEVVVKQVFIGLTALALSGSFWYLKDVFYSHHRCNRKTRQLIFLTKIYASFVAFAASFGIIRYVGFSYEVFFLAIFSITFLLYYQAFFQHHNISLDIIKLIMVTSVGLGVIGIGIFIFWPANFYSAALILSSIYSTVWGIAHHRYIEKNLTREIVYEYAAVLFVVLVMIIGSTNFGQRI